MMSDEKKIYVAGPMRGYEHFNFPAFDSATDRLRGLGYLVISPAEMDRSYEGWWPFPPEDVVFERHDYIRFMTRDLAALSVCDAIYLLPGWEKSKGARVEKAYAEFLNLEIIYQETTHD